MTTLSLRHSAALVLAGLSAFPSLAADVYSESYNQLYGPGYVLPFPGCCTWAPNTIGWYWTPAQSFSLTTVETILVNVLNGVNDDFDLTVKLYTDRPAVGGSVLSSATFNPGQFYAVDPTWHGQAFASPVAVTAGSRYFVGFTGWDKSAGPNGERGGINWVVQPGFPDNLPPGVQFLSQAYVGEDFATGIGSATTNTAAPVIKFAGVIGAVPEPAEWVLFGVGAVLLAALRYRKLGADQRCERP